MSIRVHALAKELGVSSRSLLDEIRAAGEYVTSAASMVPDPVVRMLRERRAVPTDPAPNPPAPPRSPGAYRQVVARPLVMPPGGPLGSPRRKPPRREYHRVDPPAPLLTLILKRRVLHMRDPRDRIPVGVYYADEIDLARRYEKPWKDLIFQMDLTVMDAWMRIEPRVDGWLVGRLDAAGLTPADVELRLWFGRLRHDRPRLIDRIHMGDLDPTIAARELAAWRADGSPTLDAAG